MGKNVFGICKTCIMRPCCSKLCEGKNQEIDKKYSVAVRRTKNDLSDMRPGVARGSYYDAAPLSDEDYAEFVEWDDRHYDQEGWSHLPMDNEVDHYGDCGNRCHMCGYGPKEKCGWFLQGEWEEHCQGFCRNCILWETCTDYCENLCNTCIIRGRCIRKGESIRRILEGVQNNE